ncbi:MAG: homoserine O-succinyltransferase [Deltaproteobacteria bacterium]|nr:homoserine O-succinyltransferase [Deltaproteobacteria bacterium]
MTIIIPKYYHAKEALESNNIVCIDGSDALRQDIRPLRIGILNIMPNVQGYEFNLLHPLGKSILQIEPVWIKLSTHNYTSSSQEHLEDLYITFDKAIYNQSLDGLIITGAPVEELHFEDVIYWEEVQRILIYARKNIVSTLGICWGGMALSKMIGIEKIIYDKKLFGIYPTKNLAHDHSIVGDLDDCFYCPQSRHAGYEDQTLESERDIGNINLLAYSEEAGYTIFETTDKRFLVHLGHPEYNAGRLVEESLRDRLKKRDDVLDPVNFNLDNPINNWRSQRFVFFSHWIKYIYQETSF